MPTSRQMQAFDYIAGYLTQYRVAPSLREIGAALNPPSSHAAALFLVKALCRQGYLIRQPKTWRGLAVLKYPPGSKAPLADPGARAAYARTFLPS